MSDLISRQAAITLPVMPKEHREYQTFNLYDAYEQGWNDLQKCIELLPSAHPEPQWIPCNERLPEKSGNYLVSGKWRSKPREMWICEFMKGAFVSGWMNPAPNPVVDVWMPLPEPYRGEEDE